MSVYNDRNAGCIHGDCLVAMADGTHKKVKDIRKGDRVLTSLSHSHSSSHVCIGEIECVVEYEVNSPWIKDNMNHSDRKYNNTACASITLAYFDTGLIITPWHPVRYSPTCHHNNDWSNNRFKPPPSSGKWMFPQHIAHTLKSTACDKVYNFVVKKYCHDDTISISSTSQCNNTINLASSIIVNDIECITLGHGIVDDVVAAHGFFGTDLVMKALSLCKGWKNGYVKLKSGAFVRKQSCCQSNDCSKERTADQVNSDENICANNIIFSFLSGKIFINSNTSS